MHYPRDLTHSVHHLALHHLPSPQHLPRHPLPPHLLVRLPPSRYPELKRKFYYDFCSLEEATDFFILNYDEQVSIVSKEKKVFMKDEEKAAFYTYFVNRYMTYVIDEQEIVRVSMYDYR